MVVLDVAPSHASPTPPDRPDPLVAGPLDWTAAGLLLAAAVLGVASLFPSYYAGQGSLDTRADEIVPVAVVVAGWIVAGLAVASRRGRFVVAGAWASVGIAVTEVGLRVADVGQLTSGVSGAEGLWLLTAAWAAGAVGAGLAVVAARRAGLGGGPQRPGPAAGTDRSVGVLAVAGGILAAVAFIPSWDRYLATSAVDPTFFASVTAGDAFKNPGVVIAGNVLTAVAFGLVPVVALLWRPARVGGALLAGVVVVLTAQVASAVAQVLETPDPLQLFTPQQVQALDPTVTLHLTGWFDAEFAGLMVLLIVAAVRLHHPDEHGAAPQDPATPAEWDHLAPAARLPAPGHHEPADPTVLGSPSSPQPPATEDPAGPWTPPPGPPPAGPSWGDVPAPTWDGGDRSDDRDRRGDDR